MPAKRLAVLVVPVLVLVCSALAQVNELSITAGRTFVSTQTVPSTGLPIHFGNPPTVAFNYGRLLTTHKTFGLSAELPVAIYPRMNLNYRYDLIPKDIGALFVTPSVRLNFFPGQGVSPWVSAGGGYGRFREAPTLVWGGPMVQSVRCPSLHSVRGIPQHPASLRLARTRREMQIGP